MVDPRARIALGAAAAAWVIALAVVAIVPGPAWSPGSSELAGAPELRASRVLHVETGLAIAPLEGAVMVSTGDGGGVGRIDGLESGPLRVRAGAFRGRRCWEIGTAPGRPATYVDDNGVRVDDGMSDRLRTRAWPIVALLGLVVGAAVLLAVRRRRLSAR